MGWGKREGRRQQREAPFQLDPEADALGAAGRRKDGSEYEEVGREDGQRWLMGRGSGGRMGASSSWLQEERIAVAHMSASITCE